jgi:transposase
MASEKVKTRRRYGAELKTQVLAECDAPGSSVAKVAMAHGINANVVHRWSQLAREASAPAAAPVSTAAPSVGFVPIRLPAATPATTAPASSSDIRLELRRGATTMLITWPASAAEQFAGFTRELLK